MFATLFLPNKLPTQPEEDAKEDILRLIECSIDIFPEKLKIVVKRFCDIHSSNIDAGIVQSKLREMSTKSPSCGTGQYMGLYIEKQNSVILVERMSDSNALVSAWEVQASNEAVMSTVNTLMQNLPRKSVIIPFDVLENFACCEQIAGLTNISNPKAVPKSNKRGEVKEIRDIVNPMFVLDEFLNSLGGKNHDFVDVLDKKMADEVRYSEGAMPWRREPIWIAFKAVMHVVFVREFMKENDRIGGEMHYKSSILHILMKALDELIGKESQTSLDEAGKKLARRFNKFEKKYNEICPGICKTLEENILALGERLQKELMRLENEKIDNVDNGDIMQITDDEIIRGLEHKLDSCGSVLKATLKRGSQGDSVRDALLIPDPEETRVHFIHLKSVDPTRPSTFVALAATIVNCNGSIQARDAIGLFVCVEIKIVELWYTETSTFASLEMSRALLAILDAYMDFGLAYFKEEKLVISRVLLISACLALILDKIAAHDHPMFSQYRCGITMECFYKLLLKEKKFLLLLHSMETYVKDRNERAIYDTVFFEPLINDNSFCVRFAKSDFSMRKKREEIQSRCKNNQRIKTEEAEDKMKYYRMLKDESSSLSCTYVDKRRFCRYSSEYYSVTQHSTSCKKCSLERQANNVSMCWYEKLLPDHINEQWTVVFEACLPDDLSCVRDAYYGLAQKLCGGGTTAETRCSYWWSEDLASDFCSRRSTIQLGSKSKKSTQSHYYNRRYLITEGYDEKFIVSNGMGTILAGNGRFLSSNEDWNWDISAHCTVTLSSDKYKSLEKFIDCKEKNIEVFSENEVISSQCEASEKLSLREYLSIGKLRTGQSKQLLQLAIALDQRSISFDQKDVVTIITTLLHKAGIPIIDGKKISTDEHGWSRESFALLSDESIVSDLCDKIESLIENCKCNWAKYNNILNAIYILSCLYEKGNKRGQRKVIHALKNARSVVQTWVQDVRTKKNQTENEEHRQRFAELIVLTCAMGRLTFVNSKYTLSSSDDVYQWLYFSAYMHDHMLGNEFQCVGWERSLIVESQFIAEIIHDRLCDLIHRDSTAINKFAIEYWPSSFSGSFEIVWQCICNMNESNWFKNIFVSSNGRKSKIHLNIVDGSFLVNGRPCSCLPKTITNTNIYNRWFNKTVIDVKPDDEDGYISEISLKGAHYLFRTKQIYDTNSPTIIQRRNGMEYILIPHEVLKNDFPHELIEDYSHWLKVKGPGHGNMFFCTKSFKNMTHEESDLESSASFFLEDKNKYVCAKNSISDQSRQKYIVDIQSSILKKLHRTLFKRLSPLNHIHFFCEMEGNQKLKSFVEFPRLLNLRFEVGNNCLVHKLTGLFVAKKQNFGTLNGLQNKLLLEGSNTEDKKVILVPHGCARQDPSGLVFIDTENLRSPPFLQYTLDEELRCLKAPSDRVASLYLAQLHILTSSCMDDNFTFRTGASQAFEILRSGQCCGNLITSLDITEQEIESSLAPLVNIAKASPERVFYPKEKMVMETNDVSMFANSGICHDAYAFLAQLRINEFGVELSKIGKEIPKNIKSKINNVMKDRTDFLSKRAYWRKRERYANDTSLTKEEETQIFGKSCVDEFYERLCERYSLPSGFCSETVMKFRRMGYSYERKSHLSSKLSIMSLKVNEKFAWSTAIDRVKEFHLKDGWSAKEWASHLTEFVGENKTPAFKDIFIALYYLASSNDVRECSKAMARLKYLLITLQGIEFDMESDKSNDLESLLSIAINKEAPPKIILENEPNVIKPNEMDWKEEDIHELINRHLEKFAEIKPDICHNPSAYAQLRWKAEHEDWEARQERHNSIAEENRTIILDHASYQWERNGKLSYEHVDCEKISSPHELKDCINVLFHRWRIAKRVDVFFKDIFQHINDEPIGSDNSSTLTHAQNVERASKRSDIRKLHHSQTSQTYEEVPFCEDHLNIFEYVDMLNNVNENSDVHRNIEKELNLDKIIDQEYKELYSILMSDLKESWNLASKRRSLSYILNGDTKKELHERLSSYELSAIRLVEKYYKKLKRPSHQVFKKFRLWDAVTPYTLLRRLAIELLPNNEHRLSDNERKLLVNYGHFTKHVQRARRCLRLLNKGENFHVHLMRELAEAGNKKWGVEGNIEYLLFEIDNDICIREFQAKVVEEICSDKLGNRMLQVNMGEGKSAVLMPLALVRLANGDRLARATVLSSLYKTNTLDWQTKIGGLLGRRILPMICRRDLDIDVKIASTMIETYRDAKERGSVIVTVPEHRLSFDNKAIELASTDAERHDLSSSVKLHKVLDYFKSNCRDILDECDMILSPKNQMLYTLGSPTNIDGHELRWTFPAAILCTIGRVAMQLKDKFSNTMIEVLNNECDGSIYPGFRLLESHDKTKIMDEIKNKVFWDIVNNPSESYIHSLVQPNLQGDELTYFKSCTMDSSECGAKDYDKLPKETQTSALILRGYLASGVLESILTKRWRVNYGAHPTREKYQMAVPFQAKDVAAERTEYGHPDVALILTFSHYYHQGLSKEQLLDLFKYIRRMDESEAKAIYSQWIKIISTDALKPVEIQSYDCINLKDANLFEDKLYPAFHKNMLVIYFWLTKLIYPIQAKQFPKKVTSTSWDLCKSGSVVTTGFSGTNDLDNVLPLTVKSRNMDLLKETNGVQLQNLLRGENDQYHSLECENEKDQILQFVADKKLDVLLDPGALVMQKSNEKFASEWLKLRIDKTAVVYYDANNNIMAMTQHGSVIRFAVSPYVMDMSNCLLYLDDIHTRGSDFKLPITSKAALTLGKGLAKDKFLQACMRMRQLGKGQSLVFIASSEVHAILGKSFFNRESNSFKFLSGILSWTLSNTIKTIVDLIPYNIQQACNYIKKMNAYKSWSDKGKNDEFLEKLASLIVEDEVLSLKSLYAHGRKREKLIDALTERMNPLESKIYCQDTLALTKKLKTHIESIAPNAYRIVNMFDEEQERELQQELEEEREVFRPGKVKAREPRLSEGLLDFANGHLVIKFNDSDDSWKGFVSLKDVLSQTSFVKDDGLNGLFSSNNASVKVLATTDFKNTIKNTIVPTDHYIKTPEWLLCDKDIFVIVSNFEANKLFRVNTRLDKQDHRKPRLFPFASLTRLNQPAKVTTTFPENIPPVIHVFSGSIHVTDIVFLMIKFYLGICTGDRLNYTEFNVERDGFIPEINHRERIIMREILEESTHYNHPDVVRMSNSPCVSSPTEFLKAFYCESRHLESELATSPVGILLRAKSLDY